MSFGSSHFLEGCEIHFSLFASHFPPCFLVTLCTMTLQILCKMETNCPVLFSFPVHSRDGAEVYLCKAADICSFEAYFTLNKTVVFFSDKSKTLNERVHKLCINGGYVPK